MRTLEERLADYAKSTRGMVPQLKAVLARIPDQQIVVSSHTPIDDAVRLYGLLADDLDTLLRGEELKPFAVEAEISTTPGAPSTSVEVSCAQCGTSLGLQRRAGDGLALFKAHLSTCPARPTDGNHQ